MEQHPFETIESAHEYLLLLNDSIREAIADLEQDRRELLGTADGRTLEAVDLAAYLMRRVEWHVGKARRNLGHLRTVRDLAFKDPQDQQVALQATAR